MAVCHHPNWRTTGQRRVIGLLAMSSHRRRLSCNHHPSLACLLGGAFAAGQLSALHGFCCPVWLAPVLSPRALRSGLPFTVAQWELCVAFVRENIDRAFGWLGWPCLVPLRLLGFSLDSELADEHGCNLTCEDAPVGLNWLLVSHHRACPRSRYLLR